MTMGTPGERAEHAGSVLARELDSLADPDVAGLGRSLAMVLSGAMEHPAEVAEAWFRYALRLAEIPSVALSNWTGIAAMYHQAFAEFVDQLVTAAGLEHAEETKARLLTGLMMDALAPANFWPANPA